MLLLGCDVFVLALIGALVLLIMLIYMGVFQAVRFVRSSIPKCQLVGFSHVGPYEKSGGVFEKIEKIKKELNLDYSFHCGIYHDDPNTVPKDKLRSFLCMAFERPLDEETLNRLKERGMRVKHLTDEVPCYTTYFPYRNVLSFMIGPLRVYPSISKDTCPDCECYKKPDTYSQDEGGIMEAYRDTYIQFMIPYQAKQLSPFKDM